MERKALRLPALVVFGIYVIYACVLAPLYQFLSADIVLSDTILWDIVDVFFNLFEILGISACFAFLIYGIYRYSAKKCLPLYILIGGALLFKYAASLIAISIIGGSLDLTADFTSFLASLLIEIAELALLIFLSHRWITSRQDEERKLKNAAATLGKEFAPRVEFFPFRKLFSRINPLQRAAFWSMLAVAVLRLISHVIDEISFSIRFAYGFSVGDIPVLLLYALLLVFIPCFLGYLLCLGCLLLSKRHTEK